MNVSVKQVLLAGIAAATLGACTTNGNPVSSRFKGAVGIEIPAGQEEDMWWTAPSIGGSPTDPVVVVPTDALFAVDSAELVPSHAVAVTTVLGSVAGLKDSFSVDVECHADASGGMAYNQALSERRAQSFAQALIDAGVPPTAMTAVGHGEEQPIAPNDTETGRALNRRCTAHVTVTGAS